MRRLHFLLPAALLSLTPVAASAQKAVNRSLQVQESAAVQLPGTIDEVCFYDGKLCVASGEMFFSAKYADGRTAVAEMDADLATLDPRLRYVVRHPVSGEVFFTVSDSKGRSYLYEYVEKKPGKFISRRLKPGRFSFTVERPVFSPDGRAMVFASDCPLGFGGKDLWYSVWSNGEWQFPQNLGPLVNSEGDEVSPAICGEFLIFASNGRPDSRGGLDLYATRLVALEQTGDTVTMFPIGQSTVHSLEAPFCSQDDDYAFTVNDSRSGGWWVSRDRSGHETVHEFRGRVDCIRMSGTVSDSRNRPLADASVTVHGAQGAEVVVPCDERGGYVLFLQPGVQYELSFSAPDHFADSRTLTARRQRETALYSTERLDVSLQSFVIDSVYCFADLFNSSAGSELAPSGRARLELMARFLRENPGLRLELVSAYYQSNDISFCQLLNQSRLRSMTDYLVSKGVDASRLAISTVIPRRAVVPVADAMASSSALSSQTVYFTFSRSK